MAKIAGDVAQEMTTRSLIENEVRRFLWSGHHIWSVASITAEISQKQGLQFQPHEVRSVMKQECRMRYRKIKKSAYLGNNTRSQLSRLLFAKKMFDLLDQDVRLVNIDESWIPAKDSRYMKWRAPGDTNSVGIKMLSSRIAILAAIDTRGNVYQSLSQHNSTA